MSINDIKEIDSRDCLCSSGKTYGTCCKLFHQGLKLPQTAEELMRSRYSAYALNNLTYIKNTMQGKAAQGFSDQESDKQQSHRLLGLEVMRHFADKKNSSHAFVEFRALHQYQGKCTVIQELSEFFKIDGKWFYVDGKMEKSSRNDSCPCRSGKKFKKCHGINESGKGPM